MVALHKPRVLIAEDDPDTLVILRDQPERRRVRADARGRRAHRARADRVRSARRACCSTCCCPGSTGGRCSSSSTPRAIPVPVIVCSGKDNMHDLQRARDLGAVAYLVKPFDIDRLIEVTSEVVGLATDRGRAGHRHRRHRRRARLSASGASFRTRSVSWLVMATDRFLRALRREPVDRTPVWFMRQAGRYLPEYRELRGDRDILETIRRPEEAVEITLQPLRRMPLDAAIVFSDIVVPLVAVGLPIRIVQGRGPVLDEPIRGAAGLAPSASPRARGRRALRPRHDPPAGEGARSPADRVRRVRRSRSRAT